MTSLHRFLVGTVFCALVIQCGYTSALLPPNCIKCSNKVLSFYTACSEKWMLVQTGKSVEVIGDPGSNGTVTGGALGPNLYKFYKLQFDWTTFKNKTVFEIRAFFFNTKYKLFENALAYPDGLIQVFVPVNVYGKTDNPLFSSFEKTLLKISKPGDSIPVDSEESFAWFRNFPLLSKYKYYRGSYFNKKDGLRYSCVTTLELPPEKKANYMSNDQRTFARLVDDSGEPMNNLIPPKDKTSLFFNTGFGINVVSI